ncbi:DEHA2G03058p [Debaryomyces hansenii CBS767]|uniref:DEHA2G03058p n=1 Tax=Debaryomyces hansenii (strain ATCC 36239 / CBS 767 / BCRC 21394 / JCM 1990 / NBRC 0083 / IGC 2968) TaxID=284592 RepID=Q6BJE3_DEBHA|nr:DEHA2G03058p [Debaryomyces hansenii CBS767]CAG90126.2 DEHA2G03058p [Debaryomyces hansenii CBS767]|eukprot:XP_461678.2 DEHA2G03058p [Debaryomyces hansenii CBS767]
MDCENLDTSKNFSSFDSGMEVLDTKLQGMTIFNDRTNLRQNVTSPNLELFKKLGELSRPTSNHRFQITSRNQESLNSESTDVIPMNKAASRVGLSFLPEQREAISRRNGGIFSLMVIGLAGSGKTTFINTLFGTDLINTDRKKDTNSTTKIAAHCFEVVEKGFSLKINVIDTPGFGESVDNSFAWVPATKYLDDQFKVHLLQEEQPVRKNGVDKRVHCCLYFIIPNGKGLSQLDILSMKELSRRVNLIPVISKSDTFGADEVKNFKSIINQTLELNNITICGNILDQNVKDQIHSHIPFAVMGSNEYHENSQGKLVRGRNYKWGFAEVENPTHCDFIYLREVLMGKNMLDLILATEMHHESFRSHYLGDRFKEATKEQPMSDTYIQRMDGLEQSIYFHQKILASYDDTMKEEDPILLDKQIKMKEKFAGIIANQERRFKDWKRALIEKQNIFNHDIEKLHNKIIKLQDLIAHLESGYVIDNESDYESIESNNETIKSEKKGSKNSFIDYALQS